MPEMKFVRNASASEQQQTYDDQKQEKNEDDIRMSQSGGRPSVFSTTVRHVC